MLTFVRSIRSGDFALYLESIEQLLPYVFALDHTHYSRWLPVHVRDMRNLEKDHPMVHQEFLVGKFVVTKTSRKFSAMALDQCHEQNNAMIKGEQNLYLFWSILLNLVSSS